MTDTGHWLTAAKAALALRVSPRTIRRWAALGKLPVRREVRPYLVDIAGHVQPPGRQATDMADVSDTVATELEGLHRENEHLRERIHELVQERDYLRMLAGSLAQGQQLALEARPRHRWRWPWQRREQSP